MRLGCFVVVLLCVGALSAVAADLTVSVTGVRSSQGTLRVSLFDSVQEFPRGQEHTGQNIRAVTGEMTVLFDGLPAGLYAVAIHHDENDNGKMDTGLLGIPQEGYAFSNNAVVFLGAPPFGEAAFNLPGEGRHIIVEMEY